VARMRKDAARSGVPKRGLVNRIRPFTDKWHKPAIDKAFKDPKVRAQFRSDLVDLQVVLRKYTKALADIAEVEDLTALAFEED